MFEVLDELDSKFGQSPEMQDGMPTPATRLRNETWQLIYTSDDEVFHNTLYDWLHRRGLSDRLLEIDSPYVLGYLQRRSSESLDHYGLLWQYHARRENFYGAAEVLHKLAQSDFDLPLEKRLEFLSRAKGFCGSYGPMGIRQKMNELSHTLQEELDVAVIQDDVLRRVKEDGRISSSKKEKLIKELDSNLLTLSDVCFNPVSCGFLFLFKLLIFYIYSFSIALRILMGTWTFALPFSRVQIIVGLGRSRSVGSSSSAQSTLMQRPRARAIHMNLWPTTFGG